MALKIQVIRKISLYKVLYSLLSALLIHAALIHAALRSAPARPARSMMKAVAVEAAKLVDQVTLAFRPCWGHPHGDG